MARRRPSSVETFSAVSGVGEHKKTMYGVRWTAEIKRFCEAQPELKGKLCALSHPFHLQDLVRGMYSSFLVSDQDVRSTWISAVSNRHKSKATSSAMTETVLASYSAWTSGQTLEQVAASRSLHQATIASHIGTAHMSGMEVDLARLKAEAGLTPAFLEMVHPHALKHGDDERQIKVRPAPSHPLIL